MTKKLREKPAKSKRVKFAALMAGSPLVTHLTAAASAEGAGWTMPRELAAHVVAGSERWTQAGRDHMEVLKAERARDHLPELPPVDTVDLYGRDGGKPSEPGYLALALIAIAYADFHPGASTRTAVAVRIFASILMSEKTISSIAKSTRGRVSDEALYAAAYGRRKASSSVLAAISRCCDVDPRWLKTGESRVSKAGLRDASNVLGILGPAAVSDKDTDRIDPMWLRDITDFMHSQGNHAVYYRKSLRSSAAKIRLAPRERGRPKKPTFDLKSLGGGLSDYLESIS